jgi:DNA-binding MarR family transcriptional regulator
LEAAEKIAQVRRALAQEIATRHAMSPLQVDLVRLLAASPPPEHRPTELASELAVSTATLADALQALRRKDLLTDRADPEDGRRKTLILTTKGRSLARTIEGEFAPYRDAVSGLGDQSAGSAVVALLAVIKRLYDSGVVTNDRSCATCAHHRDGGGQHGSCALLGIALTVSTLRVRCAEHQPAA